MSPTVFRYKGYRFFFFSREEQRIHIHVFCDNGEAKFWIFPGIELEKNYGLSEKQINELIQIIEDHKDEIKKAWEKYFGS